jgi:hypothetical protein
MHIGLFLGDALYGLSGYFLRELSRAWRQAGHQVTDIPVGDDFTRAIQAAVGARLDFVFGYNGFGGSLKVGHRSFYDLVGARFVAWFVDHPAHHRERIAELPEGSLVATIDPTHLAYFPLIGARETAAMWLPHFGSPVLNPGGRRDIAVLVPGSVQNADAIRSHWQRRPPIAVACEALVERALSRDRIVWHDLLAEVQEAGVTPADAAPEARHAAVAHADKFVRAHRRVAALTSLGRAGIAATVCGHVDGNIPEFARHDVRGPVPYAQLLRMMGRARLVVDTGAAFPEGSHERGLSAMANGALAVVERNGFWERFADDEVHRFGWHEVERLGDEVSILLADPTSLEGKARRGAAAVAGAHLAAHRAGLVTEQVEMLAGKVDRLPKA